MDIDRLSLDFETLSQFLSEAELKKADRLRVATQKRQYIIAQAFLRCLLSNYIHKEPIEIDFIRSKHGKPYLKIESNPNNVNFNLSHSYDLIVVAICYNINIGIDVEKIRSSRNFLGIARRFFSIDEFTALKSLNAEMQQEAFYKCWTRKEAYLKAIGKGIRLPINDFTVSLSPDMPASILKIYNEKEDASEWKLIDIKTSPDYITSLAIKDHSYRIIQKELAFRIDCFL
ncbi:4'-phosphopantetheinyl transferase superfamily protein [bacterium]|nr:4'-phosphopantetheinyl transferase superfamily protein [bacterium]